MSRPCPSEGFRDLNQLAKGTRYGFTRDLTGTTEDWGKFVGIRQDLAFDVKGRETTKQTNYYMFSNQRQYTQEYSENPQVSGCFTPFLAKEYREKAREYQLRSGYERRTGQSGQPGHGPANTIAKFANIGRKRRTLRRRRSRSRNGMFA
jgi:hypothetical protein